MPGQVCWITKHTQLFPEVRQHDGCRAFCQDLKVGFSPYLGKGLVRKCVTVLWDTFVQGGWLESGGVRVSLDFLSYILEKFSCFRGFLGFSDKVVEFHF